MLVRLYVGMENEIQGDSGRRLDGDSQGRKAEKGVKRKKGVQRADGKSEVQVISLLL